MELERLRQLMSGERDISFDASRPLFRVGNSPKVSDLLMAIPMLKADPVNAAAPTTSGGQFTMKASVQRLSSLPTASYYDNTTASTITELTQGLPTNVDFPISRLGLRFTVPRIDSEFGARNTAGDAAEWRMYAAAFAILQKLDAELIIGDGQGPSQNTPQRIKGIDVLLPAGRKTTTSANIETDALKVIQEIHSNGVGVGEGIDCFFGHARVMRKLMTTASGQRGMSGLSNPLI